MSLELYVSYTENSGGRLYRDRKRNPFRLRVVSLNNTAATNHFSTLEKLISFLLYVKPSGEDKPYLDRAKSSPSDIKIIPIGVSRDYRYDERDGVGPIENTTYYTELSGLVTDDRVSCYAANSERNSKTEVINRMANFLYRPTAPTPDEVITQVGRLYGNGLDEAEIWSLVAEQRLKRLNVPRNKWGTLRSYVSRGIKEYSLSDAAQEVPLAAVQELPRRRARFG